MFLTADLTAETAEPGGNIVITIDEGTNTLLDYKSRRKFAAQNGGSGGGAKFHGANGADTVLPVPPGTVIKDAESGLVIKDMSDCDRYILCRGGRGGWGNRHFATPTRRTPRFAKSGLKGEERDVIFELKMIAARRSYRDFRASENPRFFR